MQPAEHRTIQLARRLVLTLGLVSFFADATYEGARSITGPFLGVLGASAATISLIAGCGELVGYALRGVSGYLSDRTSRYWLWIWLGYSVNLLSVPLLAAAPNWEVAAVLIVSERLGKALRTPARDVLLASAGRFLGYGRAFGLHELLDQIGAVLGPLLVAAVLSRGGEYRSSFIALLVPAVLALIALLPARITPTLRSESSQARTVFRIRTLSRQFWLYIIAMALTAAGTADFALIAFHLQATSAIPSAWIPLSYALAMGIDALAALILGRMYDRVGLRLLPAAVGIATVAAPLVFLSPFPAALAGLVLWSISIGLQESIARAALTNFVAPEWHGTAYGIFHAIFGISWFLGSAAMGLLYTCSPALLVTFAITTYSVACLLLYLLAKGRQM